jgi:hypothetical protein
VDLVVYDPLHRRHVLIPTIPVDLQLAGKQDGNNEAMTFHNPFLAPTIDDDDETSSPLRFRVMCIALSKTEVVAFVFSSASGQWRCGTSFHNLTSYDWTKLYFGWGFASTCTAASAGRVMLQTSCLCLTRVR